MKIDDHIFNKLVEALSGEKWLEDDRDGTYYCPQDWDLGYFDQEGTEAEVRFQLLVFDDWEIKQIEQYPEGLGNSQYKLSYDPGKLIGSSSGIEYTILTYKYPRRKNIIEGEIIIKLSTVDM